MSTVKKPMVTDIFVEGAKKGWIIGTTSTLPNVLMAFVIIKMLDITGTLTFIGSVFGPVMAIFGLPGEAATVLFAGFLSTGGGCGAAMSLYEGGFITGTDIAILVPGLSLMGSQIQYMGRIMGPIKTEGRLIPPMLCISIINSCIGMFAMRFFV